MFESCYLLLGHMQALWPWLRGEYIAFLSWDLKAVGCLLSSGEPLSSLGHHHSQVQCVLGCSDCKPIAYVAAIRSCVTSLGPLTRRAHESYLFCSP